jgi:hypothetical protein
VASLTDVSVVDAVLHLNTSAPSNYTVETDAQPAVEMPVGMDWQFPPEHQRPAGSFARDWDCGETANILLRESRTGVAVFHA